MSDNLSIQHINGGDQGELQNDNDTYHVNYGLEISSDSDSVDSPTVMREEAAAKIDSRASKVHFKKKTSKTSASEKTSLVDQNSVTVSFFVERNIKKVYSGIAFADLLHRIVYLSLVANFVLFSQSYLSCSPQNSVILINVFISCCLITSAVSAIVVQSWYKLLTSTVIGFSVYVVGVLLIAVLSVRLPESKSSQLWSILAFFFICIGEAATRTNIFEIQLTQFSHGEMEQHKQYTRWFFWLSNGIAVMALAMVTGLEQYRHFSIALYLCLATAALGCISFVIPWKQYKRSQVSSVSSLKLLFKIIHEAKIVKLLSYVSKDR